VADEMEGPVSKEFTQVADQLSLGRDMPEVLDGLSRRVGLPDVDLFTSGVLLQREYGGNLAEVVDKLARTIRERFKFQSKVMAVTSTNRNSALILLVIPFLFVALMYFANRDFVRPLWETSEGNVLAGVAATLSITGYSLARRMARVEA
jgi:tight adherence protein B